MRILKNAKLLYNVRGFAAAARYVHACAGLALARVQWF